MVLLYSYIRKFFTRLYLSFLEAPSTSCFWPYPHFHFPQSNARFYRRFDLRFRSPESSSLLCSILNPFLIINIYIYESVKSPGATGSPNEPRHLRVTKCVRFQISFSIFFCFQDCNSPGFFPFLRYIQCFGKKKKMIHSSEGDSSIGKRFMHRKVIHPLESDSSIEKRFIHWKAKSRISRSHCSL